MACTLPAYLYPGIPVSLRSDLHSPLLAGRDQPLPQSIVPREQIATGRAASHADGADGSRQRSASKALLCLATAVLYQQHYCKSRTRSRNTLTRRKVSVSLDADEGHVPAWATKGAKVKVVSEGLKFYHVPKRPGPFDPLGLEGEVVSIIDDPAITPNRPIQVQLELDDGKKFKAHFEATELSLLDD